MANLHRRFGSADTFYPLDNSAVFLASVTSKAAPFVYRLGCELGAPIYLPALEEAFQAVAERFPAFKTELRPGVFWYYLDPLKKPVKLQPDSRFPVEYHRLDRWGRYLFRVRVFRNHVACEFHHCLTDGTGALEFLKSLTAEYLSRIGVESSDWQGIIRTGTPVTIEEYEDAYARQPEKKIPLPAKLEPAFHLPGKQYSGLAYRVCTGTASVAQALKAAKSRGATLTEFLVAIHLQALQAVAEESGLTRRPLCVQVPVNMRRLYPSATLRNFFLFIPVSIDLRLGHYTLEEILTRVQCTMRLNLNTKEMDRQIKRNVSSETNPLARAVPLAIKNLALRLVGKLAADKPYSGSLSNLGSVTLPEAFAAHVKGFDFLPARNAPTGANVGVVSFQDSLCITVGSLVVDRSFERAFYCSLVQAGVPVCVESNL